MPGNKYNYSPATPSTRLERLMRERELRKINKSSSYLSEDARDGNREGELFANDPYVIEGDNFDEEAFSERVTADLREINGGCEWPDGRPSKQRLLVVANRLPVSAIRKGEDSWHLEMSVGGLVTALLGR